MYCTEEQARPDIFTNLRSTLRNTGYCQTPCKDICLQNTLLLTWKGKSQTEIKYIQQSTFEFIKNSYNFIIEK